MSYVLGRAMFSCRHIEDTTAPSVKHLQDRFRCDFAFADKQLYVGKVPRVCSICMPMAAALAQAAHHPVKPVTDSLEPELNLAETWRLKWHAGAQKEVQRADESLEGEYALLLSLLAQHYPDLTGIDDVVIRRVNSALKIEGYTVGQLKEHDRMSDEERDNAMTTVAQHLNMCHKMKPTKNIVVPDATGIGRNSLEIKGAMIKDMRHQIRAVPKAVYCHSGRTVPDSIR
ncbi:hypothetical protein JX266_005602 [Neoarthrinium moseri]|nr:hypothetical protein JX266_005602 [Neoarthrinium moseri]